MFSREQDSPLAPGHTHAKEALMSCWIIAANRKAPLKDVNVSRASVTLLLRCYYRELSITNPPLLGLLTAERYNARVQN